MAARSVQISIDEELLREIDRRRKGSGRGRSEFIRRALRLYLELERRREIDAAYARGYGDAADEVWDEYRDLVRSQPWPEP